RYRHAHPQRRFRLPLQRRRVGLRLRPLSVRAAAGGEEAPRPRLRAGQYVARPPEMSKQKPVVKLQSALDRKWTSAATSSGLPVRPSGIFDSIMLICAWSSWSRIGVWITAGATLLTQMSPLPTSSFDSDFVTAMTAAL